MQHAASRSYKNFFPLFLLFTDSSDYAPSSNQSPDISRYGLAAVQVACPNNRNNKGKKVVEFDSVLLAEVGPPPLVQSRIVRTSYS